jgi:hypothetical protein
MCNFDESGTSCPLYPQCEALLDSCSSVSTGANSNVRAQRGLSSSLNVGNCSIGPALNSTRAIFSRLVFQVGLWDQVGNGADGAYLYFCFVQRREFIEAKISDPSELLSVRTWFLVGCIGVSFRLGQARA